VLRSLARPELAPETLYRYVGDGARVLVERALGAADGERVEQGVALFMEYYGGHLLDATRPYPGIREALRALGARHVALSVLTNKPAALSRAILDGLGLSPCFVAVVGGDSLPVRKPDPGGIAHLRALTGTPADRTLLVGDSPVDLHTARAAGIAFCGVAWGLVPDVLRAAGPERVIATPAELLDLVEA
jgi:phosphoglycolate phosphatase